MWEGNERKSSVLWWWRQAIFEPLARLTLRWMAAVLGLNDQRGGDSQRGAKIRRLGVYIDRFVIYNGRNRAASESWMPGKGVLRNQNQQEKNNE